MCRLHANYSALAPAAPIVAASPLSLSSGGNLREERCQLGTTADQRFCDRVDRSHHRSTTDKAAPEKPPMFDAVCDIRISSGATISYNDFGGCDNELPSADLADRASMISNAPAASSPATARRVQVETLRALTA